MNIVSVTVAVFLVATAMLVFPVFADQNSAQTAIASAQNDLNSCYSAVKQAQSAGADVNTLTNVINNATALLSNAQLAYAGNDYNSAYTDATQSQTILSGVISQAQALKQSADGNKSRDSLTTLLSATSSVVILCVGAVASVFLSKGKKRQMPIQQHKALILIVTAVLALLAASPALEQVSLSSPAAHLTEFSILGSDHTATYPFNITAGQSYPLYLTIDNHLGSSTYYIVEVKFANELQSTPDSFTQTSSSLPSLANLSFCLADNQASEFPVTLSFNYVLDPNNANQVDLQNILVNGFSLSGSQSTINWDSQKTGYYGNLFFELWSLNDTTNSFQYDQLYLSLWLNMTV